MAKMNLTDDFICSYVYMELTYFGAMAWMCYIENSLIIE